MASTITIAGSVNFAMAFCGYRQLAAGNNSEPVITAANMIMQTVITPPFTWNWNRSSVSFLTTIGVQDYITSVATFGYIEKASLVPAASITNTVLLNDVATYTAANSFSAGDIVTVTGSTNGTGVFNVTSQTIVSANATTFTIALVSGNVSTAADTGTAIDTGNSTQGYTAELSQVMNVLGAGTESGQPAIIAPQVDNNSGSITFRLLPVPSQVYQVTVVFQKKIPALISATSTTWAPIPDQCSYIYQYGFTALMLAYAGDSRWPQFSQKFVASLLGMAQGFTEDQRNIFQAGWLAMVTETQSTSMKTQQGVQSRGSL